MIRVTHLSAREYTQNLEEQLVKELTTLSLKNPVAYQQALVMCLDTVRITRASQEPVRFRYIYVDDVAKQAENVITSEEIGGFIDPAEYSTYCISIPTRNILREGHDLVDSHSFLVLKNGHRIGFGPMFPGDEDSYDGCYLAL